MDALMIALDAARRKPAFSQSAGARGSKNQRRKYIASAASRIR
jgi:hypothetical protein